MATYYARKSGNINATDVWATTPTGTASDAFSTFTNADVLVANSFTITLNVNTTVAEIRNDTIGGATAGGTFSFANNITLTANVTGGNGASTNCVTIPAGITSVTVVGNVTGGSATSSQGISHQSGGTLTVIGSITGGTAASTIGVGFSLGGRIVVLGNLSGGAGGGGAGAPAVLNPGSASITGNLTGVGLNSDGLRTNAATVTITGDLFGGNASGGVGVNINGAATVTITGTATGASSPGLINSSTGTATIIRAKGGPLVGSSVGVSSGTSSVTNVSEIEYGDTGASPTSGPIRFNNVTSNIGIVYRPNGTKKTLVDANATNLLPAASDVRSGTTYNANQTTGTCVIPPASSVLAGVPVDNTVGTALLSSSTIQDACLAALTAFSNGRLLNVSTVASFGQQLSDSLSPP